ncbi:MAG: hypothetical protein FWD46_09335, partial [Cystobacterineae bacterium]|nr:hypothetical protein [Cystobacterineae bacterium]
MEAWKLWVLGVLLSLGIACDVGGIRIGSNKCVVGVTDCGEGRECIVTPGATEGTCQQKVTPLVTPRTCTNSDECEGTQVCYNGICTNSASVPCTDGGTQCSVGYVCNESLRRCEYGSTGECEGVADGGLCAGGSGVCYQEACEDPANVPCEAGGALCPVGQLCYAGNCEDADVVPCESGGTWCDVGRVCNVNLGRCEYGSMPGECEEAADGDPCANDTGVCYLGACEDPSIVSCAVGGTYCAVGVCDRVTGNCVVSCTDDTECTGTQVCSPYSGTCVEPCTDIADCNAGEVCYQGNCEDERNVPCDSGGTYCADADQVCDTATGTCEDPCGGTNGGTWCPAGQLCYNDSCEPIIEVPCDFG